MFFAVIPVLSQYNPNIPAMFHYSYICDNSSNPSAQLTTEGGMAASFHDQREANLNASLRTLPVLRARRAHAVHKVVTILIIIVTIIVMASRLKYIINFTTTTCTAEARLPRTSKFSLG